MYCRKLLLLQLGTGKWFKCILYARRD